LFRSKAAGRPRGKTFQKGKEPSGSLKRGNTSYPTSTFTNIMPKTPFSYNNLLKFNFFRICTKEVKNPRKTKKVLTYIREVLSLHSIFAGNE